MSLKLQFLKPLFNRLWHLKQPKSSLLTLKRLVYKAHKALTHIYIYVSYSWPNGWTEWAEIFRGNPGRLGVTYAKKNSTFFFQNSILKSSTDNAGNFS